MSYASVPVVERRETMMTTLEDEDDAVGSASIVKVEAALRVGRLIGFNDSCIYTCTCQVDAVPLPLIVESYRYALIVRPYPAIRGCQQSSSSYRLVITSYMVPAGVSKRLYSNGKVNKKPMQLLLRNKPIVHQSSSQ